MAAVTWRLFVCMCRRIMGCDLFLGFFDGVLSCRDVFGDYFREARLFQMNAAIKMSLV